MAEDFPSRSSFRCRQSSPPITRIPMSLRSPARFRPCHCRDRRCRCRPSRTHLFPQRVPPPSLHISPSRNSSNISTGLLLNITLTEVMRPRHLCLLRTNSASIRCRRKMGTPTITRLRVSRRPPRDIRLYPQLTPLAQRIRRRHRLWLRVLTITILHHHCTARTLLPLPRIILHHPCHRSHRRGHRIGSSRSRSRSSRSPAFPARLRTGRYRLRARKPLSTPLHLHRHRRHTRIPTTTDSRRYLLHPPWDISNLSTASSRLHRCLLNHHPSTTTTKRPRSSPLHHLHRPCAPKLQRTRRTHDIHTIRTRTKSRRHRKTTTCSSTGKSRGRPADLRCLNPRCPLRLLLRLRRLTTVHITDNRKWCMADSRTVRCSASPF